MDLQKREDIYNLFKKLFPNNNLYRLKAKSGAIPIEYKEIDKYNGLKEKYDIYFTPNGDYSLSQGERKIINGKNIYCFFIEIDNHDSAYEFLEFDPTLIIKTKNGQHIYYLLDKSYSISEYGEDWNNIQSRLVEIASGDGNAKDLARILRLPQCKYRKDNLGETIIEIQEYNENNIYTFEQFKKLYYKYEVIEERKLTQRKEYNLDGSSIVSEIDTVIPVEEVLEELSGGRRFTKGSTVYEDGKATRGYKLRKCKNCLVNFSSSPYDRPEGGTFSVIKKLKGDSAYEAFKRIKERYNIGKDKSPSMITVTPEIISKQEFKNEIVTDEIEEDTIIKMWSGEIVIKHKEGTTEFIDTKGGIKQIINCSFIVVGYYVDEKGKNYILKYKRDNGLIGILHVNELGKGNQLKVMLSREGITYFTTKGINDYITSHIMGSAQEYYFTNKIGIYSKDVIINKTGEYIEKEYICKITDIKILDNRNKESNTEIFYISKNTYSRNDIKEIIEKLKGIYKSSVIVTLFISLAMGLFTKHIRETNRDLPIVWINGLTQSGKTRIRRLCMKLLGMSQLTEIQANSTEFVILNMLKHYVPICLSEYDNATLRFDMDNMIKNSFDNSMTKRGMQSLETKAFESNSMIIVDGENRSMDNAVFSRTIALNANPSFKRKKEESELDEIGEKNINSYFMDRYNNIFELKRRYGEIAKQMNYKYRDMEKPEKQRIINSYSLLLGFAECFELKELVEEDIIEQLENQLAQLGDDNVMKLIKEVFHISMMYKFNCKIENNVLGIDVIVDTLKIAKNKIDLLRSNIQTVNQHFKTRENECNGLFIPMDILMKEKSLHPHFNNFLNTIIGRESFSENTERALQLYGANNGYFNEKFYLILDGKNGTIGFEKQGDIEGKF